MKVDMKFAPRKSEDSFPTNNGSFAFLSKSFTEAQRSVELDLQLIATRTKSMSEFVQHQFDDLPKLKFPNANDVKPNEIIERIKESSKALAKKHNLDELEFFRGFKSPRFPLRKTKDKRLGSPFQSGIFSRKDDVWPLFQFSDFDARVNLEHFQRTNSWPQVAEFFEPLKKVSEGLKDLEQSVTASGKNSGESLRNFLESVRFSEQRF